MTTNLSSTRRTIRALRRAGRLGDEHAALVQLALSTAAELDRYLPSDVARYVVVKAQRTHLELLRRLDEIGRPAPAPDVDEPDDDEPDTPALDADALLADLAVPRL